LEARELAALGVEQRRLREFCAVLEKQLPLRPNEAGAAILGECLAFLAEALAWPTEERRACTEKLLPLVEAKNMYVGKKGKEIRKTLRKMRG
jgi:hypothetical protein